VHPNLEGNHLLAEEMILALEPLLAAHPGAAPGPVLPPGVEACAARLAHTGFDRSRVATELYRRFGRAPFTAQSTNAEARERLRREIEALGWFTTPEGMAAADEAYREALALAPEDPWLQYNRGALLTASGRFEEAAGAYRSFLRRLPQDVPGREKLSSSLAASGRFEEAAAACRALIADEPDFTPPYYTLAYALARLGRLEESLEVYREVLGRDPGSAAATWKEMGKILSRVGREEEAREALRRAAELERARPEPGPGR
jgi:tetratricopeptide (TPR) repeat protein